MAQSPRANVAELLAIIVPASEARGPAKRSAAAPRPSKQPPSQPPPRPPRKRQPSTGTELILSPWVPLRASSLKRVLNDIRRKAKVPGSGIYIPENQVYDKFFMVFHQSEWRRFLVLDGQVHYRVVQAAKGDPDPTTTVCDACYWRTPSEDMIPVLVGTLPATVQEYRVCPDCVKEGVLQRTRRAGYVVMTPKEI